MLRLRHLRAAAGLIVLSVAGCHNARTRPDASAPAVEGTWRLLSYELWNPDGTKRAPLGDNPAGYAVFDHAGRVHIQLLRPPTATDSAARATSAASHSAYFGSYTITGTPAAPVIRIIVEGSNLPSYLGSVQDRPFRLRGDTLFLGIPGQYEARLVRITSRRDGK
jgi:hypothetical protein